MPGDDTSVPSEGPLGSMDELAVACTIMHPKACEGCFQNIPTLNCDVLVLKQLPLHEKSPHNFLMALPGSVFQDTPGMPQGGSNPWDSDR